MMSRSGALVGHGGPDLCVQSLRPRKHLACTPCAAARRLPAFQQGSREIEAQTCGRCYGFAAANATPARSCRRRTRTCLSATAAAVEQSVAATSLTEAALALESWLASNGGLPAQGAHPSDVPVDVGDTALGFVCVRDVQAGEVRVEADKCAALLITSSSCLAAIFSQVQHLGGSLCNIFCCGIVGLRAPSTIARSVRVWGAQLRTRWMVASAQRTENVITEARNVAASSRAPVAFEMLPLCCAWPVILRTDPSAYHSCCRS